MELFQTLDINAPVEEVYRFWSRYEEFPKYLDKVESVRKLNDQQSQWVLRGPMDTTLRFTSALTDEEVNHKIAWKACDGDLIHQGKVEFTPLENDRKTRLLFWVNLEPPGGQLGEKILKLGEMLQREYIGETLYKMKRTIEQQVTPQPPAEPVAHQST